MWTPDASGSGLQTVLFEGVKDSTFTRSCTGGGRTGGRSASVDEDRDDDYREAKRFRSCRSFDGSLHRVPAHKRGRQVYLEFSHFLVLPGESTGGSGDGNNDGADDPPDDSGIVREWLRRLRQACFDRYVLEGRCTAEQLRTIRVLWWFEERPTLRRHAAEEGVKPAAISSRIKGLKTKAPEFYKWWTRLNANRRGLKRRPSSRTVH